MTLTPPVDESISALAKRTAAIGEKILLEHGAKLHGENLVIPTQQPVTQKPELFKLSDLTKWWNPDWTLERAGFGGAGGGIRGVRGITYLDGDTLSVWPRDEVRGALLRRSVELGDNPTLTFEAGADAGSAWHLSVFVNNDNVLDKLIEGSPTTQGNTSERHWEQIHLAVTQYRKQTVVIRLYDLVLVPQHYAGNSYWRHLELH